MHFRIRKMEFKICVDGHFEKYDFIINVKNIEEFRDKLEANNFLLLKLTSGEDIIINIRNVIFVGKPKK